MVSNEDIQEILHQSAVFYRNKSDNRASSNLRDFFVYTDGASRGNPGEAGAGAVILDKEGNVISEFKKYLGKNTNNVAEYRALILGLTEALKLKGTRVHIFSDSELMVRQLNGTYAVKNKGLMVLYNEVNDLLKKFVWYDIKYINREKNKHADRLANEAIDERSDDQTN
ncbi:MAG: reverse transcriptase-like protein [Deltaproteobacteria bacterium]|nr:MAG: reverse transcriptase-like protein [Deltaproteobacteria bacterium]